MLGGEARGGVWESLLSVEQIGKEGASLGHVAQLRARLTQNSNLTFSLHFRKDVDVQGHSDNGSEDEKYI